MTKNYLQVFNDSFQVCYANPGFINCFYHAFLNSSEEVRDKFKNTDMKTQKRMLRKSLAFMISANTNPDAISATAIRHNKNHLDIKPHLYTLWMDSMIEAVKKTDPRFRPITEDAWRVVLQPGIDYMIKMHNKS